MLSGHSADACSIFERMIRTDSSDVEGWYNLGECLFHDTVILPEPGDSSRFVFRTSWNDMIRAFRKVLELDPSYHLAFQHIYDAFVYSFRMGCRPTSNETVCPAQMTSYRAVPLRRNDTLVTVPAMSESALQNQLRESGQTHARRAHLLQARRYAEEWLTAGPNESRPLTAYFRILRRMGDLAVADSVRRLIPSPSPSGSEFIAFIEDGLELTIRQGRGDKTGALLDSLAASPDTTRAFRSWSAIIRSVMGQTAGLRPMYEEVMSTAPPWVTEYFVQMARGFAGAPAEGLFAAESVFVANVLTRVGQQRAAIAIAGSLVWTVPASRNGRWPVTDTASANPQVKLISFLATGDTARFRTVLAQFDSLSAERTEEPDMGYALLVAHAHLAIADSAGALNYLRHFRQISWARSTLTDQIVPGTLFGGMLWARTLLLLADLSAATGHREEAIEAYGLFIAMWKQGDPEVQPVVERARLALRGLQQ
jgi:hypothetical protein